MSCDPSASVKFRLARPLAPKSPCGECQHTAARTGPLQFDPFGSCSWPLLFLKSCVSLHFLLKFYQGSSRLSPWTRQGRLLDTTGPMVSLVRMPQQISYVCRITGHAKERKERAKIIFVRVLTAHRRDADRWFH